MANKKVLINKKVSGNIYNIYPQTTSDIVIHGDSNVEDVLNDLEINKLGITELDESIAKALKSAKDSGEFNGKGIKSAELNDDYTLTLTFTDGTWYKTPSIRGGVGPTGEKGADGVTPSITIGTVSTLTEGSNATATITGTATNPVLNLGIPKGDTGTFDSSELENYVVKSETFDTVYKSLPDYTNLIPTAVDTDGITVFNGVGYMDKKILNADGTIIEANVYSTTGFIPVKKGDIVYIKAKNISSYLGSTHVALYKSLTSVGDGHKKILNGIISSTVYGTVTITDDVVKWDTSTINYSIWNNCAWLRVSYYTTLEDIVITVNEEIKDKIQEEYSLKPSIKITKDSLNFELSGKSLIGKTVVCFGDSLFGMYRGDTSTPAFIAEETGATVHNVGFGGCRMSVHPTSGYAEFCMWALAKAIAENDWTSQDASASLYQAYFVDHLATLKSLDFNNVDIAVIHYGTNDFAAGGGIDIDNANDHDDYNTLCGALRYSIEKLLGAYPNLQIYISLPVFRYWEDNGTITYSDAYIRYNHTLPDFVEAIRGVAIEYNLPVIDGYYGLGINKFNASHYLADGTHHNTVGRKRFGEFIGGHLNSRQSAGSHNSSSSGSDLTVSDVNTLISSAIGDAIGGSY